MTLAFLGKFEYVLISKLQLKLEQYLSSNKAAPFIFSEISPFPFSDTPKVVAAIFEHSEELMQLQHNTVRCIRHLGITL